jgi:uncharacterized membrane protein
MSNLSFVIGLSIFAVYFSTDMMSMEWLYNTLKPVLQLPDYTVDIVGFFPWFGMVLIGIFVAHNRLFGLTIQQNRITRMISIVGMHALAIYMFHQVILFGLIWAVWKLV